MADANAGSSRVMPDKVSVVGISAGAIAIIAAIAFAVAAAFVAVHAGNGGHPAPRFAAGSRDPPAIAGDVRLQAAPAADIAAFRAEKRQRIGEYGWVDADRRMARVPIERAMALYVEQAQRRAE
ncbi:MAG TPA: hypothetical protein VLI21_14635 [Casimicrobiaceae bacterium]|nr:hypothetical protein [Casimicrobiaceae bacterium]